jgi:hypothetical protein
MVLVVLETYELSVQQGVLDVSVSEQFFDV